MVKKNKKRVTIDVITEKNNDQTTVYVDNIDVLSEDGTWTLTNEEKSSIIDQLDESELKLLECSVGMDNMISCTAREGLITLMKVLSPEDRLKIKQDILNLISSTIDDFI